MTDMKSIGGLLDIATDSDFPDEYVRVNFSTVYLRELEDGTSITGVHFLKDGDERIFDMRLDTSGYWSLKTNLDVNEVDEDIPTVHSFMKSMFNIFDIEAIVGVCHRVADGMIHSRFLVRKGNSFFCSNMKTADVVLLSVIMGLPLYIRREIFETFAKTIN